MKEMGVYTESIRRNYPELILDSVELFGAGQNSDILLINSQFIFRFPKYAEGGEQLEQEAVFLSRIVNRVPIEVPHPIFSNFCSDGRGRTFIGYKKIFGEPLEAEVLHSISDENSLRRLAGQLGLFLKKLHSINTDEVAACGTDYNAYLEWSGMYERIQSKLYPYMNREAKQWTDSHFTRYLGDNKNFEISPTPVHGDFGTSNILYDSREQRINGIIDFGSAGIDDPAVDCAGLLASYGERFFQYVMDEYAEINQMMDRITFYRGTFALQEALFGLEHNDPEAFRNGIADYP